MSQDERSTLAEIARQANEIAEDALAQAERKASILELIATTANLVADLATHLETT